MYDLDCELQDLMASLRQANKAEEEEPKEEEPIKEEEETVVEMEDDYDIKTPGLSVCLSVRLSVCLSSRHRSVCPSVTKTPGLSLSVCHQDTGLSVHLPPRHQVCLCLSVIKTQVCLSVCLS